MEDIKKGFFPILQSFLRLVSFLDVHSPVPNYQNLQRYPGHFNGPPWPWVNFECFSPPLERIMPLVDYYVFPGKRPHKLHKSLPKLFAEVSLASRGTL